MAGILIMKRRPSSRNGTRSISSPNWWTPQLVVTSEKDFRIPYTQGIAAFTALQRRNIPSRLLIFPDENHWVLKPNNSIQWYDEVFGWLHRWLAPGEAAAPAPAAKSPPSKTERG